MAYVKIHLPTQLRAFLKNKPTAVSPEALLHLLAEDYLADHAEPEPLGDSAAFLDAVYRLEDPRG